MFNRLCNINTSACLSRSCIRPPYSPSSSSPFMLQATSVDLSLLVCVVEDSWTSSFLYKSPSEPDSGDSDLITVTNKRYQHHLGWGFILVLPCYSPAPLATQPNMSTAHTTLKLMLCRACVFSLQSSDEVKWRPMSFHEKQKSARALFLGWYSLNCKGHFMPENKRKWKGSGFSLRSVEKPKSWDLSIALAQTQISSQQLGLILFNFILTL